MFRRESIKRRFSLFKRGLDAKPINAGFPVTVR
jgi:hypothetical protein